MNRKHAVLIITVSLLLVSLPFIMPEAVFAQTSGYTITQVDHNVQVMYSGQIVIQDTISVSGQVTNGFMIGLPAQYSNDILSAVAYDSNTVFQVSLGVQLGSQGGFYGAEVNFNGQSPSVFTVAFVLSQSLLTQVDTGDYVLNFPAYPALTQTVGTCNVTLTFPSTPTSITISKSDGTVEATSYVANNLPAFTYSPATASIEVDNATIQLAEVTQLNRQITIDPTGKVTASDTYTIINNSTDEMQFFILDVPVDATNIIVKDQTGAQLTIESSTIAAVYTNVLQGNVTLATPITSGVATTLTASYNLPSATVKGSTYTLSNFALFPNTFYYIDSASCTFNPPEGATIVTPQLSNIESSSTLTRNGFQDVLTITNSGVSYVECGLPQSNTIQVSYSYNPVWVSYMPTLWLSLVAVIGCVGAVVYQKRKPSEPVPKKAKAATPKFTPISPEEQEETTPQKTIPVSTAATQATVKLTGDSIREFTESYDDKKRLNGEIRSLDAKAQKGKIPRRQYKVQRRAVEIRLENIARSNNRMKDALRNSSSSYADLIKQLDSAEEDLNEAESNIKTLEDQHSGGEISIEAYKKDIADSQKRRDKAESTLNGILLRLREKAR